MTFKYHSPLVLGFGYASLLSIYYLKVAAINRKEQQTCIQTKGQNENDEQAVSMEEESDDAVEIFFMSTHRNQKIMDNAIGLHIKPWAYTNSHFSSMLAQFRFSPFLLHGKIASRRVDKIKSSTGCFIEIETFDPINNAGDDTLPIVMLLHGVGGSSKEVYIEQTTIQIIKRRWKVVVLNYSNVSIGNEGSVAGGNCLTDSHDINLLVSHLRNKYPQRKFLFCIGFSMGGAKLAQYLIRTGEACDIDGACTISSPLDFTRDNDTVHEPHGNMITTFYHLLVSSHLKLWVLKHYNTLRKHELVRSTGPFKNPISALSFLFTHLSVPEIDRVITMPLKGRSEHELNSYYHEASLLRKLGDPNGVKVPLLIIASKNDPFIPLRILPSKKLCETNQNLFIVNTLYGGHIGYYRPDVGCWATNAAVSFFDSFRKNNSTSGLHTSRELCRQKSSLEAAFKLQRSSTTGLTNYFDFLDLDPDHSCSDLLHIINVHVDASIGSSTTS